MILALLLACGDPDRPPETPQPAAHQQPAAPNQPGGMLRGPDPSAKTLHRARSTDGRTWQPLPGVYAQAASSPQLVLVEGEAWTYYVEHGEYLMRLPLDGGAPERVELPSEPGLVVDPCVVALGPHDYRLYTIFQDLAIDPGALPVSVVRSARSSDGLRWRPEPGERLRGPYVDPDVVAVDGGWRMYLTRGANEVLSAFSADGLSWSMEPGARLSGGGVSSTALHGGLWWMFFHEPGGVGVATSPDGLNFSTPTRELLRPSGEQLGVESPSVLEWDGGWWMVYASYTAEAMRELGPR